MNISTSARTIWHPRWLLIAGLAGLLASTLVALLLALPAEAQEQDEVTPARVHGEDRYGTAAAIARLEFTTSHDAFIASGENFPDALAVSYAAGESGEEDGPILLTRHAAVPDVTHQALADLAVERVFVVGGSAAVHPDAVTDLEDHGYEVTRIFGDDRYATAAQVAFSWGTGPHGDVGTLEGDRTALLASGAEFADALAAGPVAAGAQFPLLLTPPDSPPAVVDDTLEDLDIERLVVVGGSAAVSSDVVLHYEDAGYEVERWWGADRRETAAVIADNAIDRLGFDASLTLLARGDTFPDGLAASVHGGAQQAPVLLSQRPDALGDATAQWLTGACPGIEAVRALGGTAAVSAGVLDHAVAAASACFDPPPTNQSYIIGPQEPIEADPGYEQEFDLIGTYDDGPLDPVELALFPCEHVHREGGFVTFTQDPANPGYALGAGESDTGAAWISQINDVEQTEGQDRDRGIVPEGYNFHLTSDAADCTLPVMWGAGEHAQSAELPIDADGQPQVRFGVGEIRWTD